MKKQQIMRLITGVAAMVISLMMAVFVGVAPAHAGEGGVSHDDSMGNLPSQVVRSTDCHVGGVTANCSLRPNGTLVVTAPEKKTFESQKLTFLRAELPKGWDGKGFNASALPQRVTASVTENVGGKAQVEFPLGAICGKTQWDLIGSDGAPDEITRLGSGELRTNISAVLYFAYGPVDTGVACEGGSTPTTTPKTTTTISPKTTTTSTAPVATPVVTTPKASTSTTTDAPKPASHVNPMAQPTVPVRVELAHTGVSVQNWASLGLGLLAIGLIVLLWMRYNRARRIKEVESMYDDVQGGSSL